MRERKNSEVRCLQHVDVLVCRSREEEKKVLNMNEDRKTFTRRMQKKAEKKRIEENTSRHTQKTTREKGECRLC